MRLRGWIRAEDTNVQMPSTRNYVTFGQILKSAKLIVIGQFSLHKIADVTNGRFYNKLKFDVISHFESDLPDL